MPALSSIDKNYLLALARHTIAQALTMDIAMPQPRTSAALKQGSGVFVTLHKHGELRGCIGCFSSDKPLAETVARFAQAAAFEDIRFLPVDSAEFDDLHIEISVLSEPSAVSRDEFFKQLPAKPGVIIRKGGRQATFLPQVWEELPDADEFMSQLCMKAGLAPDAWKEDGMQFMTYGVTSFEEKR